MSPSAKRCCSACGLSRSSGSHSPFSKLASQQHDRRARLPNVARDRRRGSDLAWDLASLDRFRFRFDRIYKSCSTEFYKFWLIRRQQGPMASTWSLATVMLDGPTACIEVDGELYRLAPSLARGGLTGRADMWSICSPTGSDRGRRSTRRLKLVRAEDRVPAGTPASCAVALSRQGAVRRRQLLRSPQGDGRPGYAQGSAAAVLLLQAAAQCGGRRGRRPSTCRSGPRPSTGKSSSPL